MLVQLVSGSFGMWLLAQRRRTGWIGDVARAAADDPTFPKAGDPIAVLKRVRQVMADGDPAQAVTAAADEWFGGRGWRQLRGSAER